MQLDTMRLAVRERNVLDTHDMALQVMRDFFFPWSKSVLLVIVPLMVINYLLLGWMADLPGDRFEGEDFTYRYHIAMALLIYIEAPLLSLPTVVYLGHTVFLQPVSLKQVARDLWKAFPQIFVCFFLLRGILPAMLLPLLVDRVYHEAPYWELIFLPFLAIFSGGMRAFRPFIAEVILLERSPLISRNPNVLSINKRSGFLHGPSSGDLLARWMGATFLAFLLLIVVLSSGISLQVLLLGMRTSSDPIYLYFVYPALLWIVAAYESIVRYLEYLDLRIRHEGWEVELLLRAEELRLREKVV